MICPDLSCNTKDLGWLVTMVTVGYILQIIIVRCWYWLYNTRDLLEGGYGYHGYTCLAIIIVGSLNEYTI